MRKDVRLPGLTQQRSDPGFNATFLAYVFQGSTTHFPPAEPGPPRPMFLRYREMPSLGPSLPPLWTVPLASGVALKLSEEIDSPPPIPYLSGVSRGPEGVGGLSGQTELPPGALGPASHLPSRPSRRPGLLTISRSLVPWG